MALLEPNEWKYVGVDGCKGGWFSVGFDEDGDYGVGVAATFADLLDAVPDAELVLVDIPIGLPEGPNERECDPLVRRMLGKPRSSSVFRVPVRHAVQQAASVPNNHAAASWVQFQATGKKLSLQSFYFSPKISEANNELATHNGRPRVREIHPELCFWALNGRNSMNLPKRKRRQDAENLGELERLQVLRRFERQTDGIFRQALNRFQRSDIVGDDVLDALSAAVTARLVCTELDGFRTVPANPRRDAKGLPMEMVYWLPKSAR